jgi:hypothetical protein
MALAFMKKDSGGGKSIPADRVRELTSKGFSELEVIDVLRKENYGPEEIDKALSQSLKGGITSTPQNQPQQQFQSSGPKLPTLEEIAPKIEMPQLPETSIPEENYAQTYPTEEYIDYLVRERVSETKQNINEISLKTRDLEKRIENINEQINLFIQTRTNEQAQILNKIDGFKESMSDIEIRLGGMEKAFRETLPALIESVRALSDLVQRLKKEA